MISAVQTKKSQCTTASNAQNVFFNSSWY